MARGGIAALLAVVCSACSGVPCDTSTCGGCCDSSGTCQSGTVNATCGNGGKLCVACPSGQTCSSGGACVGACGPSTCAGCCDANGMCQSGIANPACGSAGAQCATCTGSMSCTSGGVCRGACGPSNCIGCCSGTGACVLSTSAAACGAAGNACVACTGGQTCNASGICAADPLDTCDAAPTTVHTAQLQASVISAKCATCHYKGTGGAPDGSGYPYGDLTTAVNTQTRVGAASLYNRTGSTSLKVVDPGHLGNSTLWLKVSAMTALGRKGPNNEPTGAKMPNDSTVLSSTELKQFKDWICTGATP